MVIFIRKNILWFSYTYSLDDRGTCRWSINTGEYLLFVKHNKNKFNILDVEKKIFIVKFPIKLEAGGGGIFS